MADYDEIASRLARADKMREEASAKPMQPTIFEKAGEAVANVPFLGATLRKLGEVGNIGLKAASTIPLALQGDFDKAAQRLGSAAMGVPQFFGIGGEPEMLDPGTVMDEMGLTGEYGRVDIPVLGTFTGRGLGKFVLSLATDPLMYTGVGSLTKAGKAAKAAGTLAEAPVVAGRVGSRLAAQALEGQRSLLTFAGRSLVPRRVSATALGGMEKGFRAVAGSKLMAPFSRYGGFGEVREGRSGAGLEAGLLRVGAEHELERIRPMVEKFAAEKGITVDEALERLQPEIETIVNTPALRRQRLELEREAAAAQARHERLVGKATSAAPDIPRRQGGTMPLRAEVALKEATKARGKAAEIAVPTVREATNLTAREAGTTPTAAGVPVRDVTGNTLRGQALRWAGEYEKQGYSRREAVRAAFQRLRSPKIDPEMAPLAAMWDRVLRPLIRDERRRGVMTETLSDPMLNWVKRSLTPEAQELLANSDPLSALFRQNWDRRFSARNASAMRRNAAFEGMKIPEMEAAFRKFFPEFKGRFWETDLFKLTRERARQTEGSVTIASLVRRVTEDFARPWDDAAKAQGFVPLSDVLADSGHVLDEGMLSRLKLRIETESPRGYMTPTALKNAENMALPREVALALKRHIDIMRNPQTPGAFMQLLNGATNSFRWLNTRLFPAFYFRNYVSDAWRNFEAGIVNPKHYIDAARVMKDLRFGKGNAAIDLGNGVTMTAQQLMDALDASGLKFGFTKEATTPGFLQKVPGLKQGARGAEKLAGVAKLGENHSRLSHIIGRMRAGDSLEDAIFSAKKYLFDYAELSPFERSAMRTVLPFYSWTRFNLPLMLETLVTKPGKMAVVGHAIDALRDGDKGGVTSSFVPPWIARRLFAEVSGPGEGDTTILSGFGLPFEDLALLDGKYEDWLSMLNPAIKFPAERATDKDFFTGRPIAQNDRASQMWRHLAAIPGGQAFLDWLDYRPTDKEGQYRANPWRLHLLTSAPVAANVARLGRTASQFENDPQFTVARFLTGIRSQTFSPEERIIQNARRTIEAAQARMRELQAQGVTGEMENKFFVRRDVLPTDPRVLEKRRLDREILFAQRQIDRLRAAEAAAGAGVGIRSGGQ